MGTGNGGAAVVYIYTKRHDQTTNDSQIERNLSKCEEEIASILMVIDIEVYQRVFLALDIEELAKFT